MARLRVIREKCESELPTDKILAEMALWDGIAEDVKMLSSSTADTFCPENITIRLL